MFDWLTWDTVESFANSNFITSALGALAGAWAGAYAAQRIAERGKKREQLIRELNYTNQAIDLAVGICTTYLALKVQYVRDLRDGYESKRAMVHAHQLGLDEGKIAAGTVLDLGDVDLKALSNPAVRTDRLDEAVEKISVIGRPRALANTLALCIPAVAETISEWKNLVGRLHALPGPWDARKTAWVFGLRYDGRVDQTFHDTVRALYEQTDQCIAFSKFLASDLMKHGEQVRRAFKRNYGTVGLPPLQTANWEKAEKKGLFPPEEDYATWRRNFLERIPKTYGRRSEKMRFLIRRTWRHSSLERCLYWLCYMPSRTR